MKMTFQPKKRSRAKFMDSEQEWPQQVEEKFLQQEEQREEKYYQHRSHICGLFFYANLCKSGE